MEDLTANREGDLNPLGIDGLTEAVLKEAVLRGEAARNSCTAHDASFARGFLGWTRTIRALRDQLVPLGWTKNNEAHFETVVSPTGQYSVAVLTGDSNTGSTAAIPKTKYAKGPVIRGAVDKNQVCFEFMKEFEGSGEPDSVWILLISSRKNELAFELSLPESMDDEGYVVSWKKRIIFDQISRDPDPLVTPAEEGPDFTVEVSRKSN